MPTHSIKIEMTRVNIEPIQRADGATHALVTCDIEADGKKIGEFKHIVEPDDWRKS